LGEVVVSENGGDEFAAAADAGLRENGLEVVLHGGFDHVQDHLKAVFEKTGARSRRELVATILKQDYLPRARAKQPLASSGFFAA